MNNKRLSKYHPYSTEGNIPPLDLAKYASSHEKALPDIPWPFFHQIKHENDVDEFCSPLLPEKSSNKVPEYIKEAFDLRPDEKNMFEDYLKGELGKKSFIILLNLNLKKKKLDFQIIPNNLVINLDDKLKFNCMICYKILNPEDINSQKPIIIKTRSVNDGKFFFFHFKCLDANHSHLIENRVFAEDELRIVKHYFYFAKSEIQIPSFNDQNMGVDEQFFNLQMKFYNLINGKTHFLKIDKDLKTVARLSLEEDFSVKKNFQTNFINFNLDDKEERNQNPFYSYYYPKQYIIPIKEFRVNLAIYRFDNGEKLEVETVINLPVEQNDENTRFECKKENNLLKINFVFKIMPIDEFLLEPKFEMNFLKNSNYAEKLNNVFALQNLSIFLKNPHAPPNIDEPVITRPKSSSLRSPIKSNSHTNLTPTNENKVKFLNPMPNFLSPQKNSPSPPSHNSLTSPKLSYEGIEYEQINKFDGESPKSPIAFIGDLPPYEEMKGNILNIAKSQNGSRILQKFFVKCTQNELENVLIEIRVNISSLMLDTYANYMFQTLIQRCTPEQRLFILNEIASSLVLLACDKKGTHSIQALVSLINCEQEEILVLETIKNDIFNLIMDSQGTHFIQKIVLRFKEERLKIVLECVLNHFIEISNNSGGVCVLKGIMAKFKDYKQERKVLINMLIKNLDIIIQNPYGNYALQHAIDIYFVEGDIDEILDKILPKVLQLSNHKFSSNVIEKCILSTNLEFKRKFIREISQDSVILELMKNKYGNFVLKKCCMVADAIEFDSLFQGISKNLQFLQNSQYKTVWKDFITNSMNFNNPNSVKF